MVGTPRHDWGSRYGCDDDSNHTGARSLHRRYGSGPAMKGAPLSRLADQAVDQAVCAWLSLGVGLVLGLSYSWWMYLPLFGISLLCGGRFINTMLAIDAALSKDHPTL